MLQRLSYTDCIKSDVQRSLNQDQCYKHSIKYVNEILCNIHFCWPILLSKLANWFMRGIFEYFYYEFRNFEFTHAALSNRRYTYIKEKTFNLPTNIGIRDWLLKTFTKQAIKWWPNPWNHAKRCSISSHEITCWNKLFPLI